MAEGHYLRDGDAYTKAKTKRRVVESEQNMYIWGVKRSKYRIIDLTTTAWRITIRSFVYDDTVVLLLERVEGIRA